jgi:hypothetical protein
VRMSRLLMELALPPTCLQPRNIDGCFLCKVQERCGQELEIACDQPIFAPDAEPSRKERGHQRCEAAPPKPERRKANWGGFLKRPGTASVLFHDPRGSRRLLLSPAAPRSLPDLARGLLQPFEQLRELRLERVGDPLRGGDRRGVPAPLDLAEVLGVHPRDAVSDLVERLASSFACLADRVVELA